MQFGDGCWRTVWRSASGSLARSQSVSGSPSWDDAEDADALTKDVIPWTIPDDVARKTTEAFGANCTTLSDVCAVTGMGKPWVPFSVGLGLQACHIVPQKHYHLYPLSGSGSGFTDKAWDSDAQSLTKAWYATWHHENSLLLFSHMHSMFDARLFSIHPETHLIRVFVPYDVLLPYHGKKARMNEAIPPDRCALAYHWDCCVYENMTAKAQLQALWLLSTLHTRPDVLPPTGEQRDRTSSPSPGGPSKRPRLTGAGEGSSSNTTFGPSGGVQADKKGATDDTALRPDPMLSAGSSARRRIKSKEKGRSAVTGKRGWVEDNVEASMMDHDRSKKQKVVTSVLDSIEVD